MNHTFLETRQLKRHYRARGMVNRGTITAVDGVDLEVARGDSLAIVGESGSGKSTLARLLLALEKPDEGVVIFDGMNLSAMPARRLRPIRRRFQAVFQDPSTSLNPRLRVRTIVAEPLLAHGLGNSAERRCRVAEVLHAVGLADDAASRFPAAFSGGERQRIAIARALAPGPELLILDEPVSNLDVTIQTQILDLIGCLRASLGLTLVIISHDLEVIDDVSDQVAVMYRGVIVEYGPTGKVLSAPRHPYTRQLIAAAPLRDPGWKPPLQQRTSLEPDPGGSCRFRHMCSEAVPKCAVEPPLVDSEEGRKCACWLVSGG